MCGRFLVTEHDPYAFSLRFGFSYSDFENFNVPKGHFQQIPHKALRSLSESRIDLGALGSIPTASPLPASNLPKGQEGQVNRGRPDIQEDVGSARQPVIRQPGGLSYGVSGIVRLSPVSPSGLRNNLVRLFADACL